MENIILKLLDILPQWLIVLGVIIIGLIKICKTQESIIAKILLKWKTKDRKIITDRLDKIEKTIQKITENDKKQQKILNTLIKYHENN